jgi:hypothetical protein
MDQLDTAGASWAVPHDLQSSAVDLLAAQHMLEAELADAGRLQSLVVGTIDQRAGVQLLG